MQFSLYINQVKALEWGLNAQQAVLFAFVYELSSWADAIEVDGFVYHRISKGKILRELPLLTDKPDTAYRLLRQLQSAGVLVLGSAHGGMVVALTEAGRAWNKADEESLSLFSPRAPSPRSRAASRKTAKATQLNDGAHDENVDLLPSPDVDALPVSVDNPVDKPRKKIRGSEKNPRSDGKKSEPTSEKNPTYQYTSNQITKSCYQSGPSSVDKTGVGCRKRFELFCKAYPREVNSLAWDAFNAIRPDDKLVDWMLRAIGEQRIAQKWHRENGRFTPRPERWLKERRWLRSPGARVDQHGEGGEANGSEINPAEDAA